MPSMTKLSKGAVKMYKIETHLHTAESSPCAKLDAAEMIRLYHASGYKTVIVTDHFLQKYLDRYDPESWKNAVDRFFLGYKNAKEEGDRIGINVIASAEIHLSNVPGDYLTYGITPEMLYQHPDICKLTHKEFYSIMHENGVLVVQAHPRRDGGTYTDYACIDGFEIINSNPRHENYDALVAAQAKEHNLYVTAGSDAHRFDDYGLSGMISDTEIKTMDEFIGFVKSGRGQLIK